MTTLSNIIINIRRAYGVWNNEVTAQHRALEVQNACTLRALVSLNLLQKSKQSLIFTLSNLFEQIWLLSVPFRLYKTILFLHPGIGSCKLKKYQLVVLQKNLVSVYPHGWNGRRNLKPERDRYIKNIRYPQTLNSILQILH